ncbi:hypothetical protein GCM10027074_19470 [Streptomyces deserti]
MVGRDAVAVVPRSGKTGSPRVSGPGEPSVFVALPCAAWAGTAVVRDAAVPIRAAAGAVTLVRYLMVRFRAAGRVVRPGRRVK